MDVIFKTTKLRKCCNSSRDGIKQWGEKRAQKVGQRLDDLRAAVTLEDMRHAPGDLHAYKGSKDHTLTLDLDGGWRLFLRPDQDPIPLLADAASLDWSQVTQVMITDVRDPHGQGKK